MEIVAGILIKYVLKKVSRHVALAICEEKYARLDDEGLKQARHLKRCIVILRKSKDGEGRDTIKQLLREFGVECRGMDCLGQVLELIAELPF